MFDENLSVQTLLMGQARTDTQIFCFIGLQHNEIRWRAWDNVIVIHICWTSQQICLKLWESPQIQ